jgi:P27 family predicted phage terminase small subunit
MSASPIPDRPALRVTAPTRPPSPPKHLRAATRKWWTAVVGEYELSEHHLKLLEAACRAWDRMSEAADAIQADGILTTDRYGAKKAHPAVAIERDARLSFARLVRELDLDGEPAPDPRMPRRRAS